MSNSKKKYKKEEKPEEEPEETDSPTSISRKRIIEPNFMKKMKIISYVIVVLTSVVALGGIFWKDLYRDPVYNLSQARGQDVITILLTVPLHVYALLSLNK